MTKLANYALMPYMYHASKPPEDIGMSVIAMHIH